MANPTKATPGQAQISISNTSFSGSIPGTTISVFGTNDPNTILMALTTGASIKSFTESSQNNLMLGFNNDGLGSASYYTYNIGTGVNNSTWSVTVNGPNGSKFTFSKTKVVEEAPVNV